MIVDIIYIRNRGEPVKNGSIEDVNVKRLTKSKSSRLIRLILTRQSVRSTVRTILSIGGGDTHHLTEAFELSYKSKREE